MFDFDLAELYEVETRVLNQAIKRNIESFSGRFYVPVNDRRMAIDVITNCDDINFPASEKCDSLRFYRA
jgi:hypothetical protein